MKKLTYSLKALRTMAKAIPYMNIPEALRTPNQQQEYERKREQFLKACVIYEHETGKEI